jgi:hypothetical protein
MVSMSEEGWAGGKGEAKSARNAHKVIEVRAVDKLEEDNIEYEQDVQIFNHSKASDHFEHDSSKTHRATIPHIAIHENQPRLLEIPWLQQ